MKTRVVIWLAIATGGLILVLSLVFPAFGDRIHQFQTLVASLLAAAAAATAYEAAISKVELDRANARRELSSRRLGLALKLAYATHFMAFRSDAAHKEINFKTLSDLGGRHEKTYTLDMTYFTMPPAVMEAWNQVADLPEEVIEPLSDLMAFTALKPDEGFPTFKQTVTLRRGFPLPDGIDHYARMSKLVNERCDKICNASKAHAEKLRKDMPRL